MGVQDGGLVVAVVFDVVMEIGIIVVLSKVLAVVGFEQPQ